MTSGRMAWPVIAYFQMNVVPLVCQGHRDANAACSRLRRVHDEIRDGLFDLKVTERDERIVLAARPFDDRPVASCGLAQRGQQLRKHLLDGNPFAFGRLRAGKLEHAANDLAASNGFVLDIRNGLPEDDDLVLIPFAAPGEVGSRLNGPHWVVDLVGETRGERAQGREAFGGKELFARPLEFIRPLPDHFFQLIAIAAELFEGDSLFGDIQGGSDDSTLSVTGVKDMTSAVENTDAASGQLDSGFEIEWILLGDCTLDQRREAFVFARIREQGFKFGLASGAGPDRRGRDPRSLANTRSRASLGKRSRCQGLPAKRRSEAVRCWFRALFASEECSARAGRR